jgi:hypothetical protein
MAVLRLKTFQTQTIFKLESRPAATYEQELLIEGNSLLSTVFVEQIDPGATVKVNYYEDTTGRLAGERKELPGHPIQSAASLDPSKITVTPFHNTPVIEVIVAGGSAKFSVHITVVNSFATDLDAALQFDGETFVPTSDKGLPGMYLDEDTGEMRFYRGDADGIKVSLPDEGEPYFLDGVTSAITPLGTVVTLDSFTVPVGATRKLETIFFSSNHPGTWTLSAGGSIIASGRVQAGHPDSLFSFSPFRPIAPSTLVTLNFCARPGRTAGDVSYHIMGSDFT